MSIAGRRRKRPLWAVAYAFGVVMAGTTLPTPLYPEYEQHYGFSSLGTTVLYAAYVLGVLGVLILVGPASDNVGRRPLLLGALVCSLVSTVVFAIDPGLLVLYGGRALSGASAGVFAGTATAALVELAPPAGRGSASLLASAVNMFGLGFGPLLAGIVASVFPAPLLSPYLIHLVLLVPAFIAIARMPETVLHRTHSWPPPRIPRVPIPALAVFIPAAVVALVAFAVLGLVTAIVPGYLVVVLAVRNPEVSGVIAFLAFASSAAGQVGLARIAVRRALIWGCLVLLVGVATMGVALAAGSFPVLVCGAVIVGTGQGITFGAGVSSVAEASPRERRAETVSAFFVVAYVGISFPVVLVGAAANVWGLRGAGTVFAAVAAVLVGAALLAILRLLPRVDSQDVAR